MDGLGKKREEIDNIIVGGAYEHVLIEKKNQNDRMTNHQDRLDRSNKKIRHNCDTMRERNRK